MKLFIAILISMAILGGFAGAEITGDGFSTIGALFGGIGTATVLLSLGAYFTAQEDKKKKADLPDDVRAVFDSMITGKQNPTAKEIQTTKQELQSTNASKTTNTNNRYKNVHSALENLRPQYKANNPYKMNAVDDVFKISKQMIKADKKDLMSDERDPYDIALTALWNTSNRYVSSGHAHIYRGILSDKGQGYLAVFNTTVRILLDRGIIDEAEAQENRDMIKRNIAEVG